LNDKPGLTHFLPARVEWTGTTPVVKALKWQGSGDVAAVANANCFLVVPADRDQVHTREPVSILLRKDVV
jgi:molybdopterin molybdotransferase